MCKDGNINDGTIDNLKNNLIIKHAYDDNETSETAFEGVNIIVNDNNRFRVLGDINKSIPTILLNKKTGI